LAPPAPKRGRHCLKLLVPRPPPTVPQASVLQLGAAITKPPEAVQAKIGAAAAAFGFKVKTADWGASEQKPLVGQCGFFGFFSQESLAPRRLLHLGWAVGGPDGQCTAKERLVKPCGFHVALSATAAHGISQERASQEGLPLEAVLAEFLDDVAAVHARGGRAVAHHIEFDAGVIANELARAGLGHRREEWLAIARAGCCLMDPDVGTWLRERAGIERSVDRVRNAMRLPAMVAALAHTSGGGSASTAATTDACVNVAVFRALQELLGRS
jgi:hypothetical protein